MSSREHEEDDDVYDIPWEMREGETSKAYNAFMTYLGLGFYRTVREAWEEITGKKVGPGKDAKRVPTYFRKWATDNDWIARARAYDEDVLLRAAEDREIVKEQVFYLHFSNVVELFAQLIEHAKKGVVDREVRAVVEGMMDRVGITMARNKSVEIPADANATITVKIGGD